MTEPIEIPFVLRTRVGLTNHVLDGGSRFPMGRGNFGGKGHPFVKYSDTLLSSVQKRPSLSRYRLGYGSVGPRY